MKIIINDQKQTVPITKELATRIENEHQKFINWLDSFDENYELIEDEIDECFQTKSVYNEDEKLDTDLFDWIYDKTHKMTEFDAKTIGNDGWELYGTTLAVLILNFPDVIRKINNTREKLGNLFLTSPVMNDFELKFMAYFPFDDEQFKRDNYKEIVRIKAQQCLNKMYEEYNNIKVN